MFSLYLYNFSRMSFLEKMYGLAYDGPYFYFWGYVYK
jgi:hypothetical protein